MPRARPAGMPLGGAHTKQQNGGGCFHPKRRGDVILFIFIFNLILFQEMGTRTTVIVRNKREEDEE